MRINVKETYVIRFLSVFVAFCLAVVFAQSPALGQGAQTLQFFTSSYSYPVNNPPTVVVTGNFNSKPFLDIATIVNQDTVSVLLGNGNGSFQNHIDFPTGNTWTLDLATGDFLNRGITDFVTANYGDCTVSFLKGNGDGTFQAAQKSAVGASLCPFQLATGNFRTNFTGYQLNLLLLSQQ